MKGIWGWFTEKASEAVSVVSQAAYTATEIVGDMSTKLYNGVADFSVNVSFVAQHLFFSPYIFDSVYEMVRQSLHAVRDFVNPAIAQTIYQSSRTRALLTSSLTMNTAVLLLVLVQQELEKSTDPDDQSTLAMIRNLYVMGIAGNLLWLFTKRVTFHNAIDRTANVFSIAHVVTEEHANNQNFEACLCSVLSRGKSFVEYPVSVLGRAVELYFITLMLGKYNDVFNESDTEKTFWGWLWLHKAGWILGKAASTFLNGVGEGQNLWVYKLDSAGVCPKHQQKLFNANNMYFFVWGLVFTFTTHYASNKLMEDNEAVHAAVYNLLYPFFVIATLTVTQPLPNKGVGGPDLFEPGRELLKYIIKNILKLIDKCMKSSNDGQILKTITHFLMNMPPIAKSFFLDRNLHSFDDFVTRPAVNRYLALCGNDLRATIATAKRVVSVPGGSVIPAVTSRLPRFIRGSEVIDKVAKTAFANEWRPLLRALDAKIIHALNYAKTEKKKKRLAMHRRESLLNDWEDIGETEGKEKEKTAFTSSKSKSDSYVLRKRMQEIDVMEDYSPHEDTQFNPALDDWYSIQKPIEQSPKQVEDESIPILSQVSPPQSSQAIPLRRKNNASLMKDEFDREWETLPSDSDDEEDSPRLPSKHQATSPVKAFQRESIFAHKEVFTPHSDATISRAYVNSGEI